MAEQLLNVFLLLCDKRMRVRARDLRFVLCSGSDRHNEDSGVYLCMFCPYVAPKVAEFHILRDSNSFSKSFLVSPHFELRKKRMGWRVSVQLDRPEESGSK